MSLISRQNSKKECKRTLRSLKEWKRTMRSERKRTRCATLQKKQKLWPLFYFSMLRKTKLSKFVPLKWLFLVIDHYTLVLMILKNIVGIGMVTGSFRIRIRIASIIHVDTDTFCYNKTIFKLWGRVKKKAGVHSLHQDPYRNEHGSETLFPELVFPVSTVAQSLEPD